MSGTTTVTYRGVEIDIDYSWTGVLDPGTRDDPPDLGEFTVEKLVIGGVDVTDLFDGTDIFNEIEELAFQKEAA